MVHDANLIKPQVNEEGISDPVNAFTENGEIVVAWWNANTKCWYSVDDPTGWGKVPFWSEIEYPKHWNYDKDLYSCADIPSDTSEQPVRNIWEVFDKITASSPNKS